ncbi:hypothetical protein GH714_011441 [Hevea brasiliensis]|uniref:Fibronectin type III-like domain-containing protein n=1 Tax=Hevea brasiliensis TaxID=3981 RepID=A0A6A6KZD9_HEVBR|nr:hypothetical protein GH714_011441 [Hevea brasiliensis]
MTDMNMRANASGDFPGRTYRFYKGETIYKFGHGLSYSTFSKFIVSAPSTLPVQTNSNLNPHSILSTDDSTEKSPYANNQAIDVSTLNCTNLALVLVIGVRNNGPMSGDHVVLAFWKPPNTTEVSSAPNIELVGFSRVEVKRGKTQNVTVTVDVCKRLSLADSEGKRKLVTGQHTFIIGSSSERQVGGEPMARDLNLSKGRGGPGKAMKGSFPAKCHSKCNQCKPCKPVQVSVPAMELKENDYYPQVWKCICGEDIFSP